MSKAEGCAAVAFTLVSTWSGAAEAATTNNSTVTITVNGTVTVGLAESVSFFTDNSTLTLEPPKSSTGSVTGPFAAGGFAADVRLPAGSPVGWNSKASFAGVIENADGSSDLVLAFAGDGAAAIGVAWTSLFVDNIADDQRVFEPQVLAQLASPPIFDSLGAVEPGSQLDRLDLYYRDLLFSGFGETATLVAFNGAGNTGVAVGTISFVPTPATAALFGIGIAFSRRRRGA